MKKLFIFIASLVFVGCTTRTTYAIDFVMGSDTVHHTFTKSELRGKAFCEEVHPVIYHRGYDKMSYYKLCVKSNGVMSCVAYSNDPIEVLEIQKITK